MSSDTSKLEQILNKYAEAYFQAKYEDRNNTCDWALDEAKVSIAKREQEAERRGQLSELVKALRNSSSSGLYASYYEKRLAELNRTSKGEKS